MFKFKVKSMMLFSMLMFGSQAFAATLTVSETLTPSAGIAITGTGTVSAGVGSAIIDITPTNAANFVITVDGGVAGSAFNLLHTDGVTTVPLALDIDGTAIATSGATFTNSLPTNGGTDSHTLNLVSGSSAASASGTYSATLTVTVTAN